MVSIYFYYLNICSRIFNLNFPNKIECNIYIFLINEDESAILMGLGSNMSKIKNKNLPIC